MKVKDKIGNLDKMGGGDVVSWDFIMNAELKREKSMS